MTKKRHWDYPSPGKAEATSLDPIAIYRVEEIPRKGMSRKPPRYRVSYLCEIGHVVPQDQTHNGFRTMEAAQRFCEAHVDEWRRQIAAAHKEQAYPRAELGGTT